jgi:hypothetical protein
MKKLLALALALTSFAASAAVGWDHEYFLNGSNLILSNNQTIIYGQTSVVYIAKSGIAQILSLTSSNIPVTVVAGTSYYTNAYVSNTNIVQPQAWNDVDVPYDKNGNVGTPSISVTAACDATGATGATNALTFTFQRIPDGLNPETVTSAANPLVFVFAVTGSTNMTFSTNLVSAFCTATEKIRLRSIVSANSTTNFITTIKNVTLNNVRQ